MIEQGKEYRDKSIVDHLRDILRLGLIYSLGSLVATLLLCLIIGWRTPSQIGDGLQYATILALIVGGSRYVFKPALPRFRKPKPEEMDAETDGLPYRRYDREQRILDQNLKQFMTGAVTAAVLYGCSIIVYIYLV